MITWFTSDHHFGHENIIKFQNRPFNSVEEMDEAMITFWNLVVSPTDTVYHLGDFTLLGIEEFIRYRSRLNGRIAFVYGGHDQKWVRDYSKLSFYPEIWNRTTLYPQLMDIKINKKYITLCHYPLFSWEKSHYGSYHLHGHIHFNDPKIEYSCDALPKLSVSGEKSSTSGRNFKQGKRFNVNVEGNDFYPYSFEEILKIFEE